MPSASPTRKPPAPHRTKIIRSRLFFHLAKPVITSEEKVGVFGNGVALSTHSQWRLLSQNAILLTSEDAGQQYGLPEPVDAVARIRELLESRVVSKVEVDQASADFNIYFDNETVLRS